VGDFHLLFFASFLAHTAVGHGLPWRWLAGHGRSTSGSGRMAPALEVAEAEVQASRCSPHRPPRSSPALSGQVVDEGTQLSAQFREGVGHHGCHLFSIIARSDSARARLASACPPSKLSLVRPCLDLHLMPPPSQVRERRDDHSICCLRRVSFGATVGLEGEENCWPRRRRSDARQSWARNWS
jgi:hypothetical protein